MEEAEKLEAEVRRDLDSAARQRLLRLVTRSFCRELVEYGIDVRDLLKVSGHVMDFASARTDEPGPAPEGPFARFALADIVADGDAYRMGPAALRALDETDLERVAGWAARDDIRDSMLTPYPRGVDELGAYLLADERRYHVILHEGEPVGLIGGEAIDAGSRRLEMRKFIGEPGMRGRGLGTAATFLWLHHVFDALDFNKVFIHSHHANARNVRLNRSLGFEVEGVLAQERMLDGRFVDIIRMGLLRARWERLTR